MYSGLTQCNEVPSFAAMPNGLECQCLTLPIHGIALYDGVGCRQSLIRVNCIHASVQSTSWYSMQLGVTIMPSNVVWSDVMERNWIVVSIYLRILYIALQLHSLHYMPLYLHYIACCSTECRCISIPRNSNALHNGMECHYINSF